MSDRKTEHDPKLNAQTNKYGFNAYDTVIALILTQYLKEREYKAELGKVVGEGEIEGSALADLLNRAAVWARGILSGLEPSEPLTEGMKDLVKESLDGFSGERYVQNMDFGFAEFLDDFYHDRIS